jgi:hypothetical protein
MGYISRAEDICFGNQPFFIRPGDKIVVPVLKIENYEKD